MIYNKKKCSCHGACCEAILGDDYECQANVENKKSYRLATQKTIMI